MKESKALKVICYIALPLLFGVILIALFYNAYKQVYSRELDGSYFQSQDFARYYMSALREEVSSLIHNDGDSYKVSEDDTRIYRRTNSRNMFSSIKNCNFVILYLPRNKVYTNLGYPNAENLDTMKEYIENQPGKKVFIINGEMHADSPAIMDAWEDYKNIFQGTYYYTDNTYYNLDEEYEEKILQESQIKIREVQTTIKEDSENQERTMSTESTKMYGIDSYDNDGFIYVDYNIEDFEVYVSYEEELVNTYDSYIVNVLKVLQSCEDFLYVMIPICGICIVIIIMYLIMAIGYKKNKEGVNLNDIDKIPIEIVLVIVLLAIFLLLMIVENIDNYKLTYHSKLYVSSVITTYFVSYILCMVTFTTIVKRIKAKTLIKNSITWRVLRLIKRILIRTKKSIDVFTESINITLKTIGIGIAYIVICLLILAISIDVGNLGFGILADMAITIYLFYEIIKKINNFKKVESQLKKIYEGDNKERLNSEEFTSEFKQIVEYINDISNGFENAVEQGIKSERLKTELITNVSHDIKTPLTSIINYADLIKQENVENEKVKEYIEILLSKSHRLKRLIEDLVEASKASSGNVKLNLELLNLEELINQTTGEFEDKFKEKKLELITNMSKEEIMIEADSRYMYRVVENIFSNVSKYALENSRVYIDVIKNNDKVKVEVKNISKEKLNISEDELMQRFVRGDKSRTTEGSGLGLSISRSLTELQHGTFSIKIDGDLFKVELEFDISE